VIDDQRIRDHGVRHFAPHALALAHAVADDLAAAEFHFFAVDGEVLLHLDPELGVRETDLIADGRAEHLRISLASDFHFSLPMTLPVKP
jgi:hypothetical protein